MNRIKLFSILVTLIIALIFNTLHGQEYYPGSSEARIESRDFIPFPLPNAEWIVEVWDGNCSGPGNLCGYYHVIIEGDTTIDDIDYNKVLMTLVNGSTYYYAGAIRQDESSGKVYTVVPYNVCGGDTLLYDFSLTLGDTLNQCDEITGFLFPGEGTISYIDSILINGGWLRQLHLDMGTQAKLIEGIGSTSGLLGYWNGWIGGNNELACFLLDGVPVFPDTSCILVCIDDKSHHNRLDINIYPNPAGHYITVEYNIESQYYNGYIEFINLEGKLIKKVELSADKHSEVIPLGDEFKSGIYVCKIVYNGEVIESEKLSIIK